MQSRLVPYFLRYWIEPVAKPRKCFAKRQRGAFGLGKIRRFAPRSYSEETVVCLAGLLKFSGAHIHTDATTIDLAGAQMNKIEGALRHTAFSHRRDKSHQRLHRFRNQRRGVFHSWLYCFHFLLSLLVIGYCCRRAGKLRGLIILTFAVCAFRHFPKISLAPLQGTMTWPPPN